VGARVYAKRYARNRCGIAFFLIGGALNVKIRIARPVHHTVAHRHGYVDPVIHKSYANSA